MMKHNLKRLHLTEELFLCEDAPKKIYVTPINSKSKPPRETVQTANSNAYEYIEEVRPINYPGNGYGYGEGDGDSHGYGGTYDGYGSSEESYPPQYAPKAIEHRYYTIKKSKSIFSDDVGFVVIIAALTVFFGALSSILIPLAISMFTGGGMFGLGGGLLGGGLGGTFPVPGMFGSVLGRRRRSLDENSTNSTDKLFEYGKQLNDALEQYKKTKGYKLMLTNETNHKQTE